MSKNLSLSLILITMNRCDELRKTLSDLKEQDTDFELIVVDNGSKDGTPEMVREYWPEAIVIELQSNYGVSGGRNRGIEAATGEILVFLDDDASFRDQDALSQLRKRFEEDLELGILATNSLIASTGEPEIAAIPRRDKKIFETDYQTTYFCGVGFALRQDLVKVVGDFFEGYFYSCEELDLSWRAIDRGYQIIRVTNIIILHRHSPVERTRGRWVYSNARNRVWLAVRHLPWRYVISYVVLWWGFLLIKSIRNLLLRDFIKGVVDCIVGLPKILKGRKVLSKKTLTIIRQYNGRLIY
jgi:GT2 family glycosyltransferase